MTARPARRVLLSRMPQILRNILEHAVLRRPDLELIHDGSAAEPNVVIVGASADDERTAGALLARWPGAQIVSVTLADGDATLYELALSRIELGRLSPAELLRVLGLHVGAAERTEPRAEPHG